MRRSTHLALTLAILFLDAAFLVNAGLFIIEPLQGSTCSGGQPCTITWLDDGTRPLLSAIGVSRVGLYRGKETLVQSITPVDVTTSHSVTFKPDPAAGPNSNTYYIAITSTSLEANNSSPYTSWSPFFSLADMSGSFDSPVPADTSLIPIPASLTQASIDSKSSTAPPASSPSPTPSIATGSQSSSSKVIPSTIVPSTAASTPASVASTSPTPSPKTSGSTGGTSNFPSVLSMFFLVFVFVLSS